MNKCKSGNCRYCGGRHHTLLHEIEGTKVVSRQKPFSTNGSPHHSQSDLKEDANGLQTSNSYCSLKRTSETQVLLSTAMVKVRDSSGKFHTCRALLDSCSQSHFVTESLVQRLNLRKTRKNTPIEGINTQKSQVKHCVTLQIKSRISSYNITVECLVLPKISGDIPSTYLNTANWNLPRELPLSDPAFNEPGKIDLLIGADIFFHILKPERQIRPGPYPVMQNTELGWILAGRFHPQEEAVSPFLPKKTFFLANALSLDDQLKRLWEMDNFTQPPRSKEDVECEKHFVNNTTRDDTGRYVVRLPFKENPECLGDSLKMATVRLYHLEGRIDRNPNLRADYGGFLAEYEALGHMKVIQDADCAKTISCYLPHHPVVKASSTTTKTRVVFDASAKTTTGKSLNDILMVGPTVQQDLQSIILRFRIHQIGFTADVEKMYRQVRVDEQDCRFQRILWRNSTTEPITTFELQTVTYGTSSAPFLATRCLQQLAQDEEGDYPKGAEILSHDFYVDDCISGASNLNEALECQDQLIKLLKRGGFNLRKWCSNHPALLESIPIELREVHLPLRLDSQDKVTTLGLLWHAAADQFQITNGLHKYQQSRFRNHTTKRTVIGVISSIFDPLGLISPIVITGKVLLQQLWLKGIDWDEELPDEMLQQWQHWFTQLHKIDEIFIDRLAVAKGSLRDLQIHGFSDASEKAYGACIYIRSTNERGQTRVKLLCAKSRVAPVKRVSLPRLELCAALVWQQMQRQLQQFWKKWSNDYLATLQQRNKWSVVIKNLNPGALVVVKEDNTPPMSWNLGVIEIVHPGVDGLVRVVTVRTKHGTYKRPINKICVLPLNETDV
ncbi:uncharacterized protein LOC124162471 [Ischnura elegans]|uniref:uncharacterized protein LOC124162471 n=1 Tax=Ischnura elegans TaxID=197161 RepID=UPI001ED89996|nr:uncharacterized protein LOC124162471 [Ischnura elegans]